MRTYKVDIRIYDDEDNETRITEVAYYTGRPETRMEPEEFPELDIIKCTPEDFEPTYEQIEEIENDFMEYLR